MYYEIEFVYSSNTAADEFQEEVTYCACIELYTRYRIPSYQTSQTRIAFSSEAHRTLAMVLLSSSSSYTVVCL